MCVLEIPKLAPCQPFSLRPSTREEHPSMTTVCSIVPRTTVTSSKFAAQETEFEKAKVGNDNKHFLGSQKVYSRITLTSTHSFLVPEPLNRIPGLVIPSLLLWFHFCALKHPCKFVQRKGKLSDSHLHLLYRLLVASYYRMAFDCSKCLLQGIIVGCQSINLYRLHFGLLYIKGMNIQ